MKEDAYKQPAWRQEMVQKLASLRPVLSTGGHDVNQLFDEFVRAHEWGLALHLVCDYLLGPTAKAAPEGVIQQIQTLHEAMRIDDACVVDLRGKAGQQVGD
jgi:hypothetical protein